MDPRQWPRANKCDGAQGKAKTERASQQREQRGLGQELLHDSPARRAERGPHGHLSLPHRTASEHQIRDVHTGDQQETSCGAEQHAEREPDLTDVVVLRTRSPVLSSCTGAAAS